MTTTHHPEETPMNSTLRSVIDLVHADALDINSASMRRDRTTVSDIASRSVDPVMLAGVTAVLAARFAQQTEEPDAEVAELRRLLAEDLEQQKDPRGQAGPQVEQVTPPVRGTTPSTPGHTDHRRAVQLLWSTHANSSDTAMLGVLREAQEDHRSVQLVLALAGLAGTGVPPLRTPEGRQWLQGLLDTLAVHEVDDELERDVLSAHEVDQEFKRLNRPGGEL